MFVVGGGCYAEYCNLRSYAVRRAAATPLTRRLVYGCSELLSPEAFLAQVRRAHHSMELVGGVQDMGIQVE